MNAVFRALGVDYVQWRAVTRSLLRVDFRLPLTAESSSLRRLSGALVMVLFLGLFGLGPAVVIAVNPDVLFTATLTLSYLSVMLVTTILSQHGSTMFSTADYVVLGPRPVSSRTFLAIRITNVLFHAWLITALMAYPAVLAYTFSHQRSVVRGATAALMIFAWSTVVTLVIVTSYSTLLRTVGSARLGRAVGYLQVVTGLFTYGGLLIMNRWFGRSPRLDITMPDDPLLLLVPPAWYASYLEIVTGTLNSTTWWRAGVSVACGAALLAALRGKLSLDYAGQLAEVATSAGSPGAAAARTPLFDRGPARAVAILVLAHFRHDLRVRMGILAVVPLILFYVMLGIGDHATDLVSLAVLLFPAMLSQQLASTDAYRASWIYAVTPMDPARIVVALKNVAVAYFLVPFLLFVFAVFTWRDGDIRLAAAHTTILGLVSHLALQGSMALSPRLPFAQPPDKTRGNAALMAWMFFVIIGGQVLQILLYNRVYGSALRTAAVIAVLILLTFAAHRVMVHRARAIPS